MPLARQLSHWFARRPEVAASRRDHSRYTLDELRSVAGFGRSTDPRNPLSRQTPDELLWLVNEHLLALKPRKMLEIGVASGGTTLILCRLFPEARVFGMDLTDALLPRSLRAQPGFKMVIGNTNDPATRDLLIAQGGDEFDFMLIDGDHSEQGVRRDAELYLPRLRNGGLAVFHDVRLDPPKGIKPTWNDVLKPMLPGSQEYFVDPNNNGFGLWYKA